MLAFGLITRMFKIIFIELTTYILNVEHSSVFLDGFGYFQ